MSEANLVNIFNQEIEIFNKSVEARDRHSIASNGFDLISSGIELISKGTYANSVVRSAKDQCIAALKHLSEYASNGGGIPQRSSSGGEENSVDPYYSEQQWFSDDVPDLNFTNIIGAQDVKDAFMVDIVAPLRSEFHEVYRLFRGNTMGTQILLYGPPGTGKTHCVRCLAGALGCKLAIVNASEVLASIVGVAEKNIRDIFRQASELDRCIIFIDEIDSLCADRDSIDSRNTKSVLTTLLTCMDGFNKKRDDGKLRIIIAATNLPWKLDSALKRGGRFETQIYLPLPDKTAVAAFVKKALGDKPRDEDVTVEYLTSNLLGCSGADIDAIIKQIANRPLKREVMNINKDKRMRGERITLNDCEEVLKKYIKSVTPEMLKRFEAYKNGAM